MSDREKTYEAVKSVYQHNGLRVSLSVFFLTLVAHGPHELEQTQKAIRAAKNNGVFIETGGTLIKNNPEILREVLELEANKDDPDKKTIANLNQALQDLR